MPFYYLKGDHDNVIMTFSSQCTHLSLIRGSLPDTHTLEMGHSKVSITSFVLGREYVPSCGVQNFPVEYFERIIFPPYGNNDIVAAFSS